MRKQLSFFFFALFNMLFIVSCRKSDIDTPLAETPSSIEKFFNLPESADPRLKAIAQSIRQQEKERPFLKDFTKRAGWPVWNKVKMIGSHVNTFNARSTSGTDSTTLVYIPFVQDSAIFVNSVLAVKLEPSDTAWRILYANNYESFGFDTTVDNTWNARNIFQFFALFQYDIFGHTKFLIKDERLFNTPTDSFTVTLREVNGVAINSRTNRTTDEYSMTICTFQTVCPPAPPAPPPATDNQVREQRITDDCYGVSTCNTFNWGDGGTSWTGSGWSGSGGGGSSGGWGTTATCMNSSTGTPIACSPGWTPIDNNGFYIERLNQLQAILDQDPYFLIPCDYLSQFQTIGSFQPPQAVRDRLDAVNATQEAWAIQHGVYPNPRFDIQMLDNAAGTVVNCDYFPIKITTLPTINGVQLTAQQVFEHFRNNMNTVINTSIAEFEAYTAFGINDQSLWNAQNPFTALVHIDMVDDGTVIISDYQLSTNTSRMKASTLVSPLDMTHPVSGTREWGIQPTTGGYIFYTTAVDRMTTKFTQIVDDIITIFSGQSTLTQGDDLWKSLQDKMIEWIVANGGQAQKYPNNYVTARPDYSAVRDFLLGQIDLSTMRQRIGCP